MDHQEIINNTGPVGLKNPSDDKVKGQLIEPKKATVELVKTHPEIAGMTFEESLGVYPDFLRARGVDEGAIEKAITGMRQDYSKGDTIHQALILEGLKHAVRDRLFPRKHILSEEQIKRMNITRSGIFSNRHNIKASA